jgi:hypothetical protein
MVSEGAFPRHWVGVEESKIGTPDPIIGWWRRAFPHLAGVPGLVKISPH